ncbi:hypothetical protein F2P81_002537 [Scophthalmus maximus]|uniref:Uncharacterized protein n=1 Tax=Scophthalmus maximus TaxID=52904 RepID=A0A6A4TNQ6_SCOMX|nr:hypothetical protein F2P81_002537 [Scophthalmus maximus]
MCWTVNLNSAQQQRHPFFAVLHIRAPVWKKSPQSTKEKDGDCFVAAVKLHENTCVDIMHDVLEGVAPLEVKLLLRHFIYEEKLFTLEQLNDRIAGFDYGYMNDKNKPSAIINLRSSENAAFGEHLEARHRY